MASTGPPSGSKRWVPSSSPPKRPPPPQRPTKPPAGDASNARRGSGRRAWRAAATRPARQPSSGARGSTNRAIATQLYISIRTVNTHLSHIYDKLGVHDRTDLGAFVAPRGGVADRSW
jgi:hypothetical protein